MYYSCMAQPSKGEWKASFGTPLDSDEAIWVIYSYVGGKLTDIVCEIAPLYVPRGKAKTLRKVAEEEANANLIAQSKLLARAILALLDAQGLSDGEFKEKWGELDPVEYAIEVVATLHSQSRQFHRQSHLRVLR